MLKIEIKIKKGYNLRKEVNNMILVTGATGHIGNVLVKRLISEGERVRVFIPKNENISPISDLDVEILRGDIRNLSDVNKSVSKIDTVFHLAGIISITHGKEKMMYDINVGGTQNIVKACLKNRVKRLIYTSSIHAFPDLPKNKIIDENVKIDPNKAIGEYGKSKALATIEVIKGIKKGLDAVIVCPTGIIGPYDYKKSEIGELILEYSKKRIGAYIKGAYDFVDVRDVVDGHILAWKKGKTGEVYILSGEKISIRELFSTLEKYTNVQAPKIHIPATIAKFLAQLATIYYKITKKKAIFTPYAIEVLLSNSNISSKKARKDLGFRPRDIKESLKDAIKWMLTKHSIHTR